MSLKCHKNLSDGSLINVTDKIQIFSSYLLGFIKPMGEGSWFGTGFGIPWLQGRHRLAALLPLQRGV